MRAIELVRNRDSKAPWPELAEEVLRTAESRGLLVLKAGLYGNVIRLLPPLILSDDELRRGLEILEASLVEAWRTLAACR